MSISTPRGYSQILTNNLGVGTITSLSTENTNSGTQILALVPSIYSSPVLTMTDYGPFSNAHGNYLYTGPIVPAPGTYTITGTLTSSNQPPVSLSLDIYVPFAFPPTDAAISYDIPVTTNMPEGSLIGTVTTKTGAMNWVPFASDSAYQVIVPGLVGVGPSAGLDTRRIATKGSLAAGTYPISVVVMEGTKTYTRTDTLTVASATVLPSTNIAFTPAAGITNRTAPGSVLGTPTVTGMNPTLTRWWIIQDRGYRFRIDPITGAITNDAYLAANYGGGENFTLCAGDGTYICTTPVFYPVSAPAGPVLEVGPGKTYSTIQDAYNVFNAAATTTYANATIKIYYGTYLDDMTGSSTSGQACNGPLTVVGVPDPVTGKLPLITYTLPRTTLYFKVPKGVFTSGGYDLTVSNLEIANVRQNNGFVNHQFSNAFRAGDTPSRQNASSIFVSNCILHDIDTVVQGGDFGCRWYIENCVSAYNSEGVGLSHHLYPEGTYVSVKNTLFFGGSQGHVLKSRADRVEADGLIIIPGVEGCHNSPLDFPNGGNVRITNSKIWIGPNSTNGAGALFEYGEEYASYNPYSTNPTQWEFALGSHVLLDSNAFYNLVPATATYYPSGHNKPYGPANFADTSDRAISTNRGPTDFQVNNCIFAGFNSLEIFGPYPQIPFDTANTSRFSTRYAGPVSSSGNTLTALIPDFNSYLDPANWPLLTAVPGFTTSAGSVGPSMNVLTDLLKSPGVPAPPRAGYLTSGFCADIYWISDASGYSKAPTVSHTAAIGTVVATATGHVFSYDNAAGDPIAGATFSLFYVPNSAYAGLFAVSSSGVMTVASSLSAYAGTTIVVSVNMKTATNHDNPLLVPIRVT